jgi:two-component system chemotaxis response regulator CheY
MRIFHTRKVSIPTEKISGLADIGSARWTKAPGCGLHYQTRQIQKGSAAKAMDILLVDDSKTMRLLVQRAIRQAGYRHLSVGEAENGAQALDKLKAEEAKLILSDWNMPEMSGINFLQNLRRQGNTTFFGFITSEASAEIKELALRSGASFVITKPFEAEDIQAALEPILGEA